MGTAPHPSLPGLPRNTEFSFRFPNHDCSVLPFCPLADGMKPVFGCRSEALPHPAFGSPRGPRGPARSRDCGGALGGEGEPRAGAGAGEGAPAACAVHPRGRRERGRPGRSRLPSTYLFFPCGPRSLAGLAVPGLQLQHRAEELLRGLGQEADLRVRVEPVEMGRLGGQLGVNVLKVKGELP